MEPAADWANFLVAEVGAAAALAGLVTVAISINLARILAYPLLPGRAGESLFLLTGVFALASLALIPGQPTPVFGLEALVVGVASMLVAAYNQARGVALASAGPTAAEKVFRALVTLLATVPIVVGAGLLLSGRASGSYCIAAGIVVALASGVWNAWVLLVEIMR